MAEAKAWRRADYAAHFEKFLNGRGKALSKTKFGYYAVGEPSFFVNLKNGTRNMKLGTIERALDFVETFVSEVVKVKKNDKTKNAP